MALPTYNRNNRRQTFQQLPKAAYVVRIMSAKTARTQSGNEQLVIAFDIAEGEYKDFYMKQYDADTREDKKYPNDAYFYLNVPDNDSPAYQWVNWNNFFADLEDSNNGFVFDGDVSKLTGKLLGGKFAYEKTESNGNIYDHTRLRWTCVAEDVRQGKAGKLPNDRDKTGSTRASAGNDGFDPVKEAIPW